MFSRTTQFHVWSLTWKDVESRFSGDNGHFEPLLKPLHGMQRKLISNFDKDTEVGRLGDMNQLDSFSLLVRLLAEPNQRAWQASAALQMLVHMDMSGCDGDDIALELEQLLGEESPWIALMRPLPNATGLVKGGLADADSEDKARIELLTWVPKEAISRRALDAVRVVCRLHDLGDIRQNSGFKEAWNGFLRLYNLMQFLPECLFVTAQGLREHAYQTLEFVSVAEASMLPAVTTLPELSVYADLVDAPLLEALCALAAHGVCLPDPALIPFELCGPYGNVIGQAELAWEECQVAFVYADDAESRQAFTQAGWRVQTVEELVAKPAELVHELKGEDG